MNINEQVSRMREMMGISEHSGRYQFSQDIKDDPDYIQFKKDAEYKDETGQSLTFGTPRADGDDHYVNRARYSRVKPDDGVWDLDDNDLLDESELPTGLINNILKGYVEAALWTEEESLRDQQGDDSVYDDDEDEEDTELDKLIRLTSQLNSKGIISFSREDIEPDSLIDAYMGIKEFIRLCGDDLIQRSVSEFGAEQLGHDIWLTRNRHGAGFFDRGYDDEDEKILINAAHKMGGVDLYINDNNQLSFSRI